MTLEQVFLRVPRFYPVSIISLMFHIHLHMHVALIRRTNNRSLGTFQKAVLFRELGNIGKEKYHICLGFQKVCSVHVFHLKYISITPLFLPDSIFFIFN